MKKHIIFGLLLLLCLFSVSCYSNNPDLVSDTNTEKRQNGYSLYATDRFQEIIDNNPIDEEYRDIQYAGSISEFIKKTTSYRDLWKAELENTYNLLLSELNAIDKESLKQSQNGWSEYIKGIDSLQISFFYEYNYNDVGQDKKMFAIDYQAKLTKSRTLELMEYLFSLTGQVEFIYNS